MKELWNAFVARLVHWFTPKPPHEPGICECGHERCSHSGGTGRCHTEYPPDEEWPHGARCACQIYIRAKDDGGDDAQPDVPTPSELERMYQR